LRVALDVGDEVEHVARRMAHATPGGELAHSAHVPAKWAPVRGQEHAPR
jgi:hypothetical protein